MSRMDIGKLQQRYIVEVIPRLETYEVAEKRIQDVYAMCALVVKHWTSQENPTRGALLLLQRYYFHEKRDFFFSSPSHVPHMD